MLFPFLPLAPAASSSPSLVVAYDKTKQELSQIEDALSRVNDTEQASRLNNIKQAKLYEIDQMELLILQHGEVDYRSLMRQNLNEALQNAILFLICERVEIAEWEREGNPFKEQDEEIFSDIVASATKPDAQLKDDYDWIMDPAFDTDISFDICCQVCNVNGQKLRANIKHKVKEASLEDMIKILRMLRSMDVARKIAADLKENEEEVQYIRRRTTWGASPFL